QLRAPISKWRAIYVFAQSPWDVLVGAMGTDPFPFHPLRSLLNLELAPFDESGNGPTRNYRCLIRFLVGAMRCPYALEVLPNVGGLVGNVPGSRTFRVRLFSLGYLSWRPYVLYPTWSLAQTRTFGEASMDRFQTWLDKQFACF